MKELPAGQWWVRELAGSQVATEEGRVLGTLRDVLPTRANDVFVVWTGTQDIYLPALRSVVLAVDLPHKKITVRLLPGLEETF